MTRNYKVMLELMRPFLISMEVETAETLQRLSQELQQELYAQTFCGLAPFLTAWGKKGTL